VRGGSLSSVDEIMGLKRVVKAIEKITNDGDCERSAYVALTLRVK
jgi:hypothetical protein